MNREKTSYLSCDKHSHGQNPIELGEQEREKITVQVSFRGQHRFKIKIPH
jgi:hypothetical protein